MKVLAILALVALAAADDYVWVGGNTNFNEIDNWDGAVPLEGNGVSETDMRSERAFTSFVASETYNVGARIRLPRNGKLVFQADAPVTIKFTEPWSPPTGAPATTGASPATGPAGTALPPAATSNSTSNSTASTTASASPTTSTTTTTPELGPVARFLGIRDTQEFSFNCKHNWRLMLGEERAPATTPPCSSDAVFFDGQSSYAPFSEAPITNVEEFHIGSQQFSHCMDLPDHQFDGLDCARFFIDDKSACVGPLGVHNPNTMELTGECLCFNSCPTGEEEAELNQDIRRAAELAAEAETIRLNTVVSRDITVEMPFSVLGSTNEDTPDFLYNPEFLNSLTTVYNTTLGTITTMTVSGVEVEVATGTLTIHATIVASTGDFLALGESSGDLPEGQIDYEITQYIDVTRARVATWTAHTMIDSFYVTAAAWAAASLDGIYEACTDAVDNTTETADACQQLVDSVAAISQATIDTDVAWEILTGACPDPFAACSNATEVQFVLDDNGISEFEQQQDIIDVLADFNVSRLAEFVTEDDFDFDTFFQLTTSSMYQLLTYVGTSDTIAAGANLPIADIALALNEDNVDGFLQTLERELLKRTFISALTNVIINLPSSLARREIQHEVIRVTSDAGVSFIIDYEYEALAGTQDDFAITFGSLAYNAVRDIIESVLASYDSTTPECFDIESNTFEVDCLEELANEFVEQLDEQEPGLTLPEVEERVLEFLNNLIECGGSGRGADGECLTALGEPINQEDIENNIDTFSSDAASTYTSSPSSASASSGIIIYAAAGAGGLILIIIIIILIVRRRGNGESQKSEDAGGRTVVAFENPMYDNPEHDLTGQQAIYEDAGGDDEGLYDEPAFNDTAKMNPLYQSTEDLVQAGDGPEEEGGYLDVAPEDE